MPLIFIHFVLTGSKHIVIAGEGRGSGIILDSLMKTS